MLVLVIGGTGYLYGGLIGAVVFKMLQEFFSDDHAAILAVLDRSCAGRDRACRPRAHPFAGRYRIPNLVIRQLAGRKAVVAVPESDAS